MPAKGKGKYQNQVFKYHNVFCFSKCYNPKSLEVYQMVVVLQTSKVIEIAKQMKTR